MTTNSNNTYRNAMYNHNLSNLSGNKLRINTQESSESGNSATIQYCNPQIYSNLMGHTPNSSNPIYRDDE